MVLIKRVVLAAAMSLLSEGAIAGVGPAAPSDTFPPSERPIDGQSAAPSDAALSQNC